MARRSVALGFSTRKKGSWCDEITKAVVATLMK
jgi:hypothetical protein